MGKHTRPMDPTGYTKHWREAVFKSTSDWSKIRTVSFIFLTIRYGGWMQDG